MGGPAGVGFQAGVVQVLAGGITNTSEAAWRRRRRRSCRWPLVWMGKPRSAGCDARCDLGGVTEAEGHSKAREVQDGAQTSWTRHRMEEVPCKWLNAILVLENL